MYALKLDILRGQEKKVKLHFYKLGDYACDIVPAPRKRDWMDAFPDSHPYRCLPLAISNSFGWQLLSPCDLEIEYTGGPKQKDLIVRSTDGYDVDFAAESNFSRGILTFYTNYLFQTEPGWQLVAAGPLNEPKDGFYPLTGIIETDWLPYPFTMNWQLTRPGKYKWAKGEPFCQIFPIPKNYIPEIVPEIYSLDDNPELKAEKEAFQTSRSEFRARMDAGDEEAIKQAWQRFYFRGKMPTGTEAPETHTNKLRANKPVDKIGTPVKNLWQTIGADEGAKDEKPKKKIKIIQQVTEVRRVTPVTTEAPKPQSKPQPVQHEHVDHGPPEEFKAITSQSDTDEIMYMEGFLSPEVCKQLIETFERNVDKVAPSNDEFFKDRVIWMTSLPHKEDRARSLMQQARFIASYHVGKFFGEDSRLFDDVPQLVKWWPGMSMPAHADNEHPDGGEHQTPHRKYAGVTFLNDEYEGGNFYLEKLGLRIPATPGLLVGFKGDMSHMHGVTEVKSGLRYTMPMWFSANETDKDTITKIY